MRHLPKLRLPSLEPGLDDPVIGHVLFTDGVRRPVFEGPGGRQYVVNEGKRVDGVWIYLAPFDESPE